MGKHDMLPMGPGALSPGFNHESNKPGDPIPGPSRHLPTSQPIPSWQSPGGWQCPGLQVRWQRRHNAWLPFLPPAWSLTLQLQAQGNFKGKSKLHLSAALCVTRAAGVGWGGAAFPAGFAGSCAGSAGFGFSGGARRMRLPGQSHLSDGMKVNFPHAQRSACVPSSPQ